ALTAPADRARSPERANALVRAGGFALYEGDAAAARPLVEESLAISHALGDRRGEARCQSALAVIATYAGEMEVARDRAAASLALYRELGEAHGAALALHNMGDATLRGGDPAGAAPLYEQAIAALRSTGDARSLALALSDYAMVALRLGDLRQAEARFAEALEHARALGAPREGVYALEGVAELAEGRDEPERAAEWLGVAGAARATLALPLTPAEKAEHRTLLARLEARLGADFVARAMRPETEARWEDAVDRALTWLRVP
ncbi:MAG: tetratricopeptide repeat protein, partial [Candidatus Eisenbacteria bacterium]|nr:tetratricopeptide repeat protein [Candidatus Eisenbacteria bacterium]